MHSFAAVKELINMYGIFDLSLKNIEHSGTDQNAVFEKIERRLSREADSQVIEEEKLARAETQLLHEDYIIEEQRKIDDERKVLSELDDEKKILVYQEELLNIR